MRVEATRQSSETVYDLFTNEETAKPLLRSHVRAIDNSEDDLLLIYLEAAVDYMQNLSDRLLGVHDVTVYIDKDESKRGPVTFSGVQNVTSVGPLFYNAKDPDDESPFSLDYKMIGDDAIDTDVEYTYGDDDDYGVGREYQVGTTGHGATFNLVFNVSVIDTTIDNLDSEGDFSYVKGIDPKDLTAAKNQIFVYLAIITFGVVGIVNNVNAWKEDGQNRFGNIAISSLLAFGPVLAVVGQARKKN